MRALLSSLRKLILGETWTIPLGVGAGLGLAVALRASVPVRNGGASAGSVSPSSFLPPWPSHSGRR